jgi:cytochrome c-type biogenesis protein CcmH
VPAERSPLKILRALALSAACLGGGAYAAGEAVPVAADPELEARVQALSHNLRCLVCQNESVAESRAPLAVDMRNQVREQLAAGKSEQEVVDFLVARFGDFVVFTPPFRASTALLWIGPGLLLVAGVGGLALRLRRRIQEAPAPLDEVERARARALLVAGTPPEESRK